MNILTDEEYYSISWNCIENTNEIKQIQISTLCLQTLPCRHELTFIYNDNRVIHILMSGSNLINLTKYLNATDKKLFIQTYYNCINPKKRKSKSKSKFKFKFFCCF
jgi:hypothetical protein